MGQRVVARSGMVEHCRPGWGLVGIVLVFSQGLATLAIDLGPVGAERKKLLVVGG